MKSFIFLLSFVGVVSAIPFNAYSLALDCCGGQSGTHDDSCTTHLTTNGAAGSSTPGCCLNTTIESTLNGITSTYTCDQQYTKAGSTVSTKCVCSAKTYKCANGYYGTPNATGTSGCNTCPSNATCTNGTITCDKSYYLDNNTCAQCPPPGITGGAGATKITACFLYTIDETATNNRYYDKTGYFNVTSTCYYSTTTTPQYPVLGIGTPKS